MTKNIVIILLTICASLASYNSYNRGKMIEDLLILNNKSIQQQRDLLRDCSPYLELKPILESKEAIIDISNDGVSFQRMEFRNGQRIN